MDHAAQVARSSSHDSIKLPNVEIGSMTSQSRDEARCKSEPGYLDTVLILHSSEDVEATCAPLSSVGTDDHGLLGTHCYTASFPG